MISVQSLQIPSLHINVDEKGDIIGAISLVHFLKHIESIPPNKRGFLNFRCEKRRQPVKTGLPRSHTFPIFEVRREIEENDVSVFFTEAQDNSHSAE